jgi:DNA-binding SARP family transcriptional activator
METEFEGLFKQKIEDEVAFMAIRRTIQNMKVVAGDRLTLLEERSALVLNKLG